MATRRHFLQTAGAGAVALSGMGATMIAQTPEEGDAVLAEIQRQLERLLTPTPSADDLRQGASAFRLLGAHASDRSWNARIQAAVRRAIRTQGRDALVAQRPNPAELRRVAPEAPVPMVLVPALDVTAKGRAVDALARGQVHLPQQFRLLGEVLDATADATGVARVRRQTPFAYPHMTRQQACMWMGTMSWIVETITIVVCILPGGQGLCIPFSVVYIVVNTINYFGC